MCPTIELYIRNDSPLVIKYRVADMGSVHLILSPINNDDINNDGKTDKSDKYLAARRKKIGKIMAMKGKK